MMPLPSVMDHRFSEVPFNEVPRSSFDRSHGHKTTFDVDQLIPIFVDEALPGDTFTLDMAAFGRLATPLHPLMDNMYLETHFFAVPNRLLWDNWERFNGAQDNPEDSTDYLIPQVIVTSSSDVPNGSLADYFGLPTEVGNYSVSALPFRAYGLIFNEWFRDQNLQESIAVKKDDTDTPVTEFTIHKRGKRHDYFTSCLPWPQKGESVNLPLGGNAPVYGDGTSLGLTDGTTDVGLIVQSNSLFVSGSDALGQPVSGYTTTGSSLKSSNVGLVQSGASGVFADLTAATSATINDLREAFQVQKMYEKDARGGTRYTEIIKSHFGVTSSDARLQRPEYLGGGSQPLSLQEVPQTSSTDATSPQGNLAAFGTVGLRGHGFTKTFEEHCTIIGLVSVRADLTYQQGLNRMWSRRDRFDFYWPSFAHLGEQAVLNKEIFTQGTAADDEVFGYQERYAEYRYKPSQITGQFRSNFAQSLDTWHLSQDFGALPALNAEFIESNTPIDRAIAVPSEPHLIFDSFFKYTCARPMPTYSVPGLIDHF